VKCHGYTWKHGIATHFIFVYLKNVIIPQFGGFDA
jgi:hypothetical protein